MSTDAQLRDQAIALLQRTTDPYPTWVRKGKPASSNWAKAFSLLTQIAPPPQPPPPPGGGNPVPPPSSGVYLGAYIEGAQTYGYYYPAQAPWTGAPLVDPGTSDAWAKFEANVGKKVALLMVGAGGHTFQDPFAAVQPYLDATVARGTTPVLDLSTQNQLLTDLSGAKYDAGVAAWAKAAAAWGHPFVLRVDAEMNGKWYDYGAQAAKNPASFVAAWRHIHDLFTAAGAKNVSWHWCPNVDPDSVQTPLEQLYPGDAYVDWLGMTGYDHGNEAASYVFDATYQRLVKLSGKPIMIGEIGGVDVGFPGDKAKFIQDLFAAFPVKWPQVKAFCWFNWRIFENNQTWDWPVESSLESLAAFQKSIASSYVVGR